MQQTVSVARRLAPDAAKDPHPGIAAGNGPAPATARDDAAGECVAPHPVRVADAQLEPLAVEARLRRASYLDRSLPIVAPLALLVLFLVAWLG